MRVDRDLRDLAVGEFVGALHSSAVVPAFTLRAGANAGEIRAAAIFR
jgi:hypothetical protein